MKSITLRQDQTGRHGNGLGRAQNRVRGLEGELHTSAQKREDEMNDKRTPQQIATSGWIGCQVASFRWRAPLPQGRVTLHGAEFRVVSIRRRWGLHSVTGGMEGIEGLPFALNTEKGRA